jgi:lactoylglutathione lyase
MRTLFVGYRVSDLERSLAFYQALGYRELGRVELPDDSRLSALSFPDEAAVTLELVHRPDAGAVEPGGFDHLAIQVDDLALTLTQLSDAGLEPGPPELPGGQDGPRTSWLTDPDGYRIELVQWPEGHHWGMTAADFA